MRKLLLLATTVALMLSACSNDREISDLSERTDSEAEINFRSFIDKGTETRATVTDGTNILGFTVTGWWDMKGNGENKIGDLNEGGYLFNAFDITRRETGVGAWDYDPKIYWPTEGNGVYFFAYSPASSKNIAKGLYNYTYGEPIEYQVPDPSIKESQEDFLLARTDVKKSGVVSLDFAHVLSRVRFFARTTNTKITYVIYGVEMININKYGKIDVADLEVDGTFSYNDSDPTSTPLTVWTDLGTPGNLGIDMGESPLYLLGSSDPNKYYSLQGETNALMVLPQKTELGDEINGDKTGFWIKVSYKAYLNNVDGTYFAGNKDKALDVYFKVTDKMRSQGGTETSFAFEIGRQYNFCLEFGEEAEGAITFKPEVGSWDNTAPRVEIPQITNYHEAGLISDVLAEKANANFATEGVTLGDILGIKTLSLKGISKADLKGLKYFENLKKLSIGATTEAVDIDLTGLNNLTDLELCVGASVGTLNISNATQKLKINIANYPLDNTSDKKNNLLAISNLIVWDGFNTSIESAYKLHFNCHTGVRGEESAVNISSVEGTNTSITALKIGSTAVLTGASSNYYYE
ncbi:fimbrillin family protein [Odoribacter sp. OttesenSCG-928-G04]|nr:fimbrillin family protein [Odoribacter sp. OttesenSCG-928-G04]